MRTTCRGQLFPQVVSVGKKYLNLLSHLAAPLRVFLRFFFFFNPLSNLQTPPIFLAFHWLVQRSCTVNNLGV